MIIVIALDSADPDLVANWLEEGKLPFLKSLKEKGIWCRFNSIANLFSDTQWSY